MAFGSTFGVSPGDRFFEERGYYRSGSLFKRFQGSASDSLNQQAVSSANNQSTAAAQSVFTYTASQSEQFSVLAAEQLQQRVQGAAAGERVNILI